MAYTKHGHWVPGTEPLDALGRIPDRINCGGIHSCTQCAAEATTQKIDDMLGGVVDRTTVRMELGDVVEIHGFRFVLHGLELKLGQQPKAIFASPIELLKENS